MNKENVYEVIKKDSRSGVLARILENSGLGEELANERRSFTFFAPTDDAFADLSDQALAFLLSADGRATVAAILSHHLIPKDSLYSTDLLRCKRDRVENMNGDELEIRKVTGALRGRKAHIFSPGMTAMNGVVFPVDKILPASIGPFG
jgi:uncharacterized surface protein with fasciclin (FAS1) repeats